MKKISVIIPVYNCERDVKESIISVLNQDYENIEVVVVDDGSTDNSENEIKTIEDSRITYFKLENNSGVAHARNIGVEIASGDVIAFHDSDDFCFEDRISRQYEYLNNNQRFRMVYSGILVKKGKLTALFPPENLDLQLEGNIFHSLLKCNTIDCPTIMTYKKEFIEIGRFNESYSNLSDWEFVIRFAEKYEIGYVKGQVIESRLLETGISSNRKKFYVTRARMIAETKDKLDKEGIFSEALAQYLKNAEAEGLLDLAKHEVMKQLISANNVYFET